jgi:hypothetical protein
MSAQNDRDCGGGGRVKKGTIISNNQDDLLVCVEYDRKEKA